MNAMTRRILLVVIVLVVIGSIYYLESGKVSPRDIDIVENVGSDGRALLKDGQFSLAPELGGIVGYINTNGEEIKISDFKGKVVLVDFWTYSCINCIRTLPFLKEWHEKYSDKGLVIIGVHTPEFEFEKEYENVLNAVEDNGIEYFVVQDNDYVTWRSYENRFWPRKYLIDSEGYIRYDHIGEGAYQETELVIQNLLSEIGMDVQGTEVVSEPEKEFTLITTPELYAGHEFAFSRDQNVGNIEGLVPGEIIDYSLLDELEKDVIYLDGEWKSNPDDLELVGNFGSVVLDFVASEVNIVADSLVGILEMEVLIDGEYISSERAGRDVLFDGDRAYIIVDGPRLFNVYDGPHDNLILTLQTEKGFTFNSFTFG
jgi:thiol-disulfide isomerase/thioredoxin